MTLLKQSVICGGFVNGNGTKTLAFAAHGGFGGQEIAIHTGYFDASNNFVDDNLGFGGTRSMMVEIRVYP
jgi:hypothetical protein